MHPVDILLCEFKRKGRDSKRDARAVSVLLREIKAGDVLQDKMHDIFAKMRHWIEVERFDKWNVWKLKTLLKKTVAEYPDFCVSILLCIYNDFDINELIRISVYFRCDCWYAICESVINDTFSKIYLIRAYDVNELQLSDKYKKMLINSTSGKLTKSAIK